MMINAPAKDQDSTSPALLARVRAVLDAVLTPERLAAHDEGEFYDVELHRLLAKEGLFQTNRLDRGQQDQVLVLEELGARATSVAVSYVIQYMGMELLRHYASAAQSQRFLSPLMAGDAFTSLALSEAVGGTDVARVMETTVLKRPDGGYVISGSKKWIGGAADADFFFVLARTSPISQSAVDGITTFIVPRDIPGIHTRPIDTMGIRALEQCDVVFNDVHVEAGTVLGEAGQGFRQILRALNTERLNGAAVALGIARGALDTAVQYAKDRPAFRRPNGAFQGLQHMLAESSVRVEAARQLVTKAAQIAEGNAETDGVMAAMAKLAASEAATTATDTGMRVMGAWGFARQSPMQRYFRDARLYTFAPITDEVTRNYIGEKHLGLPRSYLLGLSTKKSNQHEGNVQMETNSFDINKNTDIFRVHRAADLAAAPGQTVNARRISGVSKENSAADRIWFGKVHTGPGEVSDPHHHGEAQTGGYVLKGRGFIRYGEGYGQIEYLEEGDFVFVPPLMPHIEGNASKTEELIWMTTRTPDNIVVNLENQDVLDLDIDYRS